MKNTAKTKLILALIVITISLLLIQHYQEKQELRKRLSYLEQQLKTQEEELQSISNDMDTQLSELENILRNCTLTAQTSLEAVVCSKANRFYQQTKEQLSLFHNQRETLENIIVEYKDIYNRTTALNNEIHEIQNKLKINTTTINLEAESYEVKKASLDAIILEFEKAQDLFERSEEHANELYEEYYPLMLKLVACEAGDYYYPDKDQYYIMNVVENRIESEYYPNNIYDVIFQDGQYASTWDGSWKAKKPDNRTKANIKKYLQGDVETGMPSNVLYQSMFKQGTKVWKHVPNTVDAGHYYCFR